MLVRQLWWGDPVRIGGRHWLARSPGIRRSDGVAQFLAENSRKDVFQRFMAILAVLDVFAQGVVDERLVIATANSVDFLAEPVEDIVVQVDRNAGLAGRG